MTNKEIILEIEKLKKDKNAVILVHNYQLSEIQDIADYLGDSLALSRKAGQTNADIILFCGVYFMAETAKILSPHKKVLIPDKNAGCPMADMITPEDVRKLRQQHPDAIIVSYVNSSAEVKAESDICCTSSNAVKVVESLPKDKPIIFIPDKYLGDYVRTQTKRDIILWNGYCPTHLMIKASDVLNLKQKHSDSEVLVHPECSRDVIDVADYVYSTAGMGSHAEKSNKKEFIIGTENGMLYRLQKDNPDKKFYYVSDSVICPNMKLITLEKVLWALQEEKEEIVLEKEIIEKAKKAVNRMIEI